MPFGFEADVLEIMLREVQGLHVKVIIIESTLTHQEPFQKKASQWVRSLVTTASADRIHFFFSVVYFLFLSVVQH
jgi:hypothetical protein